jgi:hypothetical protein
MFVIKLPSCLLIEYLVGNVDETQLVTSLACSVAMALGAILQANMALFMSLKTGRAICCGRTQVNEDKYYFRYHYC